MSTFLILPNLAYSASAKSFRCEVKFAGFPLKLVTINQPNTDYSVLALINKRGQIHKTLYKYSTLGTIEIRTNVPKDYNKWMGNTFLSFYKPERFPLVITQTSRRGNALVGFYIDNSITSTVVIHSWRPGMPKYIYPGIFEAFMKEAPVLGKGKCVVIN